jgi:hypothetical protein
MTSENPLDTTADTPLDCYRCGYNLHTIADDQPCPECGLLAARSRRASDELHETRPKWLASISWGVNLVLLSFPIAAIWPFLTDWFFNDVIANRMRRSYSYFFWYWSTEMAGLTLAAILVFSGVFLLTRPEGYEPSDRADRPRRIALRISAAVPLLAIAFFSYAVYRSTLTGAPVNTKILWAALTLLTLGAIPVIMLGFLHLRAIAKRARSAQLAEHCVIVGIGTSALCLFILVFAICGQYFDLGPAANSPLGLIAPLILVVSVMLFGLWSLYLLIRFAISFRRAAKQIRQTWSAADRSIESK